MKKFFKNLAFGVGWSLLLLHGCTKDSTDEIMIEEIAAPIVTKDTVQDIDGRVLAYIKNLGYSQEQILEDIDSYAVDGDIIFPKDMIVPDKKSGGLTDHLWTGIRVTNPTDIRVFADANMNPQNNEINAAIALWNNADSRVRFRRVFNLNDRDIRITNLELGDNRCGNAVTPNDGIPGNQININIRWVTAAGHNFAQRMVNIAHELGHSIGFQHTTGDNNGPAIPVLGFPEADLQSIMRGGRCGILNTVLSANDIGAVRSLYPLPALSVRISGPVFGNNSSYYTWSAAAINGTAPYTYTWRYSSNQGSTYPYPWGNNTASVTAQMPNSQNLYLKVFATDATGRVAEGVFRTDQRPLK